MKLKPKWGNVSIKREWEGRPVRIINDAAIATPSIGEGRLIPLVIIDTAERPDIVEYVRVHQHLPPGDLTMQWGRLKTSPESKLALFLQLLRPAELLVILEFDTPRHGGLVDQILAARALYLQPGRDGDWLANTFDAPRVLLDILEVGFDEIWAVMRHKHLVGEFRRRGLSRSDAKRAAKDFAQEWSKFGRVRFGSKRDSSVK
jgi:hypothetical protein